MMTITPERPLACWRSEELYNGIKIPCLTIIFKSGGCSWNQCTMCGYCHERYRGYSKEDLIHALRAQLAYAMETFPSDSYEMVKIFTSGSFLDSVEVPPEARDAIGNALRGKIVIAESRVEYVTEETVNAFRETIDTGRWDIPLYIASGLETINDQIREHCIRKGHTYQDYIDSTKRARAAGAGIKTYLMMKPPYLTEAEAKKDMHTSVQEVSKYADMISMNLCTIQSKTPVERLWKKGAYRPPYLWSALEVLIEAPRPISCDPVGGGKIRGPHNCGTCDREIVPAILEYSLSADKGQLQELFEAGCDCKAEWEFVLENEQPWSMPLTR